jgi:hypothetical protein
VAVAAAHARLELPPVGVADPVGPELVVEAPAVGAGADVFVAEAPAEHRPAVTIRAGTSTLAAPIRQAGVVLSQPARRTTPSRGLPRISSSTAIAMRFR